MPVQDCICDHREQVWRNLHFSVATTHTIGTRSDLSASTRTPPMSGESGKRILEELFRQGDKELALGVSVPSMRKRFEGDVVDSQVRNRHLFYVQTNETQLTYGFPPRRSNSSRFAFDHCI